MVRTVYTDAYSSEDNYLFNTGKIVLWTVVECGLGIIAGSLPMLKFSRNRQTIDMEGKAEEFEMQKDHAEFRRAVAEAAGHRH